MRFASREEAGRELGRHLRTRDIQPDVVVGLPRGGVVVAAEVARILQRPLSVLIVRKIGHPHQREFAVGALAEPDVVLLDEAALHEVHMSRSELNEVITEEKQRLHDYQKRFHPAGDLSLNGKKVALVDDGLATGATAEAAVLSARKQNANAIIFAVPVASDEGVLRLQTKVDEVIALIMDSNFESVGHYYDAFPQTSDDEVLALLNRHA